MLEVEVKTNGTAKEGLTKSKNRLFPADEIGIPLSIHIPEAYRNEEGLLDRNRYALDRHHRFAPKKDLLHKEGELGKILRYSCLQVVPQELHTLFNCHYNKPELPATKIAKFGAIFLSIARYLPAEAIDVTDGDPVRREMTQEERQLVWANNELRPEQGSKIQREIIDYVTGQNVAFIDEKLATEFIYTSDPERRIDLGKRLFRVAAEVAVQPVERAYVDAWESGLLPRHDVRAEPIRPNDIVQARAVPKRPNLFIARHIVTRYGQRRAIDRLYDNVAAQLAA